VVTNLLVVKTVASVLWNEQAVLTKSLNHCVLVKLQVLP